MGFKTMNGSNGAFRTGNGENVEDVERHIREWLKNHPEGRIYIGCDSKARGNKVKYATVICMWDVGHGVWEIYKNEIVSRPKDRFTRLWDEVMRSVEIAESLKDVGDIHVHMDYNSDPKYPSYQLL